MAAENVSGELRQVLKLAEPKAISYRVADSANEDGFVRELIEFEGDDGALIPAFLFIPNTKERLGGVVAYHQHNSEFHLGKSEIAGLVGDPWQAFGPELARRGIVVLAPDAVAFEDRRQSGGGTEPGQRDWLQHYNEMAYRLQNGDLLMRKCMDDAQRAVSALISVGGIGAERVGVLGHSFGGALALYQAALDSRCQFACASGSVCSFTCRQQNGTGISMLEVVPNIARRFDIHDMIAAIQPRPLLVVSAREDQYSLDAEDVLRNAGPSESTTHLRFDGGHALDQTRFDAIVEWLTTQALA